MKLRIIELKYSIKHSFLFYCINSCILTLVTIVAGVFLSIIQFSSIKGEAIKDIYDDKAIYVLTDTVYDPDEFWDFRNSDKDLNGLGEFYNSLNKSEDMTLLSVFDQALYIKDFNGGAEFLFDPNYSEEVSSVKSVQMNYNTYDFYNITLTEGDEISWQDIHAEDELIPVYLGSEFKNVYDIGDIISADYYMKNVNLEVKGILDSNSTIYYQGTTEFYLDQSIIIPYPWECSTVLSSDSSDKEYKGILYFAMINSYIATESDNVTYLESIETISAKTGFNRYLLLGESFVQENYKHMVAVIDGNILLSTITVVIILFLSFVVQIGISFVIIIRRKNVYKQYNELGIEKYNKEVAFLMLIPYIVSLVTSFIFFNIYLQDIVGLLIGFSALILLALYLLSIVIICKYLRYKKG